MSWIRDAEGRVINLDKIEVFAVVELEENEDGNTHALQAQFTAGETDTAAMILFGYQADCEIFLINICRKLHMVAPNG